MNEGIAQEGLQPDIMFSAKLRSKHTVEKQAISYSHLLLIMNTNVTKLH